MGVDSDSGSDFDSDSSSSKNRADSGIDSDSGIGIVYHCYLSCFNIWQERRRRYFDWSWFNCWQCHESCVGGSPPAAHWENDILINRYEILCQPSLYSATHHESGDSIHWDFLWHLCKTMAGISLGHVCANYHGNHCDTQILTKKNKNKKNKKIILRDNPFHWMILVTNQNDLFAQTLTKCVDKKSIALV